MPREEALKQSGKVQQTRVPFVVTFNPRNPPLRKWHNTHFEVLRANQRLREAIPEPPIVGERRCRSLRDLLMPSNLPSLRDPSKPPGCFKCTATRCVTCKEHLEESGTFSSGITGETFTIREHVTCESSNIVYLLGCRKCPGVQYVGETQNALSTRFYTHRSHINKNTGTHVTRHFNTADHSLQDVKVTVIERVFRRSKRARLARESFWIKKLSTLWPQGLNTLEHL